MTWSILKGTEQDRPALAGVLVVVALIFLGFQDGLVKFAAPQSSLWQFQFFRASFNLCFIFLGLLLAGQVALAWPKKPRPVLLRSAIMVLTMIFFFAGAPFITLAEMGAGLYTYPVFTTLLGWLVLKEAVGRWRLSAILLAVLGAALIIRPWSVSFHPAQALPVCAGFCYSINSLILRRYCRAESPVTMAIWSAGGFWLAGLAGIVLLSVADIGEAARAAWPFLAIGWPGLVLGALALAALASICNVIGNLLIVKGYQSAEISWLAPIDYSYLIVATFWGFVLFSDLPDGLTVLGMALIAAGGILTAWREARLARREKPNADPVI